MISYFSRIRTRLFSTYGETQRKDKTTCSRGKRQFIGSAFEERRIVSGWKSKVGERTTVLKPGEGTLKDRSTPHGSEKVVRAISCLCAGWA